MLGTSSHNGLEATLEKLNITSSTSIDIPNAVGNVRRTFGDLLSTSPSNLILTNDDAEVEAKMWDCFAEVFEKELQLRKRKEGGASKDEKRQILADILVWAEITQEHYDDNTASFVTQPHEEDDSFQRIGNALREAKRARGV